MIDERCSHSTHVFFLPVAITYTGPRADMGTMDHRAKAATKGSLFELPFLQLDHKARGRTDNWIEGMFPTIIIHPRNESIGVDIF
jgi:hypothetical protein